jgi:SAM-dependent methyltransferase
MANSSANTELSASDAERFRAYERRRHDALAQGYDNFFTPVTKLAIGPLLKAVRPRAGMRLLDVATGTGALAAAAEKQGAKAVGTDLSPGMVALAAAHYPGIEFREADVERLSFPDASFDAVVCNFGIAHFPYPERAAAECARVLKAGGRLAFSWWDVPEKQRIQGLFREAITEIGAKPPPDVPTGYSILRFADSGAFRALLEGAGLSAVVVEEHTTTHRLPNVDALWRGGLGSFAVTASAITHQDEPTQAKIRAALERRAKAYMTVDGLVLPVAFKIAAGRK